MALYKGAKLARSNFFAFISRKLLVKSFITRKFDFFPFTQFNTLPSKVNTQNHLIYLKAQISPPHFYLLFLETPCKNNGHMLNFTNDKNLKFGACSIIPSSTK